MRAPDQPSRSPMRRWSRYAESVPLWLAEAFEKVYSTLYRHVHERSAIVVDACRLVAYGILPSLSLPHAEQGGSDASAARRGWRRVYLGAPIEAPILSLIQFFGASASCMTGAPMLTGSRSAAGVSSSPMVMVLPNHWIIS